MSSYNKVIIMGNLTRDPELRYTPQSKAVVKIGVAVNERWKDANGQQKESVTFIDAEAWGKTAEVIGQYFKKGSPIMFDGKLKLDTWEDKNTKAKMSKLKVVLENFQFVGGKQDGQQQQSSAPQAQASDDDQVPGLQ